MQTSPFIALVLLDDTEIVSPASLWEYFKLADISANNTNQTQQVVVGYMKNHDRGESIAQELHGYRANFLPQNYALLESQTGRGYPFKRVIFDLHSFYMDCGAHE